MLLVRGPHCTQRRKRLLKLISTVIGKLRYKQYLWQNSNQCQTLGGVNLAVGVDLRNLSCLGLLFETCWLAGEGETDVTVDKE